MFNIGLHIGQQLAGVVVVGEGVDHRHGRVGREGFHNVMAEGADHDDVHHGRDDPRAILYGLTSAQLGVGGGQEHGVSAQLRHAGLERRLGCVVEDLAKDHAQNLAGESGVDQRPGL